MKINTKLLTVLSISMLLANGAQAQEAWDLTRCIDYAIAHNLTVKQQEAARDKSEVELNTAKWSRLPDLNGSASHSFNFGRSLQANNTYQSINTQNTSLPTRLNNPFLSYAFPFLFYQFLYADGIYYGDKSHADICKDSFPQGSQSAGT